MITQSNVCKNNIFKLSAGFLNATLIFTYLVSVLSDYREGDL